MLILYATIAISSGIASTAVLWPALGWLAFPIGMLVACLAVIAAAATTAARHGGNGHHRDREERLREERRRDRDERLFALLDQCPIRMRHTLIDGANITSERGR